MYMVYSCPVSEYTVCLYGIFVFHVYDIYAVFVFVCGIFDPLYMVSRVCSSFFFKFEIEVIFGLVRVGWAAGVSSYELGTDDRSFGYGATGKKSWNR